MSAPLAIDWFRLLWDLIQRGHSIASISRRSKISESTLKGYLHGSHPPHWRGEVLIAMWCQSCDKARDSVPKTEVVLAPRVVHRRPEVEATEQAMNEIERAWR